MINLLDDGAGGVLRVPTETYYANRLILRGLLSYRERLQHSRSGFPGNVRSLVAREGKALYVIILRENGVQTFPVDVDLSALGIDVGPVTIWVYSVAEKTPSWLAPK